MNKKAILATILVVQLVFLVLFTFSIVRSERIMFSYENDFRRLSAYRMAGISDNLEYDLSYLESKNSTDEAFDEYLSFVDNTFSEYVFLKIEMNRTYIKLEDTSLELLKEVSLE